MKPIDINLKYLYIVKAIVYGIVATFSYARGSKWAMGWISIMVITLTIYLEMTIKDELKKPK